MTISVKQKVTETYNRSAMTEIVEKLEQAINDILSVEIPEIQADLSFKAGFPQDLQPSGSPTFKNLSLTNPLTAPNGGTGFASYTIGDTLYASSTSALSKLPIGASGRYLSSSGSAPQWTAPAALTRVDDTNVTLTLGGSASTALLNAASITVGWSGTLAAARLNANVVQAVTNDTNVTGSIAAQNLTLGWTGTLAAARLNANVVQSVVNDTNVTGSIATQALTLGWTGTLETSRGGTGNNGTPTSWTPADNSGAGLTFTGVSAEWQRIGNMVFAYASFTYPATASGAAASISGLPVTVPNTEHAKQGLLSYTNCANANKILPVKNTTTAGFFTSAGVATTNAQLAGFTVYIMLVYPAV